MTKGELREHNINSSAPLVFESDCAQNVKYLAESLPVYKYNTGTVIGNYVREDEWPSLVAPYAVRVDCGGILLTQQHLSPPLVVVAPLFRSYSFNFSTSAAR